jgi:glycosyltransferase involved in cell wall biosynthesis
MKKIQNLVVISHGLRKEFIDFGFPKDKIIVAPDGVDLEMFNLSASQKECREKFSFPKNKKIIMYTGNFYFWKGADLLLEAVKYLPNYFFVFVGGTEKDLQKFNLVVKRDNLENILLLGYQPYHLIPYYLKSADLLVLPNRGEEKISKFYTSPMKLFEYLASGVPMVAANLPSLREILSEKNSFLFKADDLQDLIKIINFALHISSVSAKISQQALFDSHKYDWLERARLISKTF